MHQAASSDAARPSVLTLFLAFSGVAVLGFGGVMPFARRMLVEQRRWLDPEAFNEAFSLAQFLPGGNIINLAVVVGRRFRGIPGALASVLGLVAGPLAIMIALGAVYARYREVAAVQDALTGVAAAAAGLILAMAAKMAAPLLQRRALLPIVIAAGTFFAVAAAELPLLLVIAAVAPLSVALAWRALP